MTPEEISAKFQAMESRILELENKNQELRSSADLPLELDLALQGRGYTKGKDVLYFNANDFAATSDDIALSGDAETITVMGSADAWGRINGGPFEGFVVPLYVLPRTF